MTAGNRSGRTDNKYFFIFVFHTIFMYIRMMIMFG